MGKLQFEAHPLLSTVIEPVIDGENTQHPLRERPSLFAICSYASSVIIS